MITVNSVSGGKTSAYIAANYKADYNVFSLVRTNDKSCLFPDAKLRQEVSDRLGVEFIGTLEDDMIVYTIFDLEQYIGQKIDWVTGKTFDEIITNKDGKTYLPNVFQRFCTSELKLVPLYNWWKNNFSEPVEMRIGYRANETRRALRAKEKESQNGFQTFKDIIGKSKSQNKWAKIEWQKQVYPLIEDNIYKDHIDEYWKDRPVRFAYMNNCIGCFHRNEMLLRLMADKFPDKFDWFVRQEKNTYTRKPMSFKKGITYERIRDYPMNGTFDFDDFTDCDSGYCGI